MKGIILFHLVLLCSVASAEMDTAPAKIQNVNIIPQGAEVMVRVVLTARVAPHVMLVTNPDRLVLELPNTTAGLQQKHVAINEMGIKELRFGLTRVNPPVTRLVLDLDTSRPYGLKVEDKEIALTVLPAADKPGSLAPLTAPDAPLSAIMISMLPRQRQDAAGTQAIMKGAVPARGIARLSFKVKYIAEGAAYLDGGSNSGLAAGMKLQVRDFDPSYPRHPSTKTQDGVVAELRILAVASNSAIAEIQVHGREVRAGDKAYLSPEDTQRAIDARILKNDGSHPAALAFTRPTSPTAAGDGSESSSGPGSIRGRIGLDYSGINSHGSTTGSSRALGLSFQSDITRILGTHWNLQGYWHGRMTHNSQPNEDVMDAYLNKTFTMQLYYDNPDSNWVAGFGRLYLPWAASLDTIDGGYVGRKVKKGVLVGLFAGSTPDPASWHYAPDRRTAGTFVNFEGGNYDNFHYSSTAGLAMNSVKWQLDRPYIFFENEISYKKTISLYHQISVDYPTGLTTNGITPGPGVSRSYLTLHYTPYRRISFDLYHNYFRDVPTASTALIGTGLVHQLLYQGLSAGVRVEALRHVFLYTTLGQSTKTGDSRRTLNQMYGVTFDDIGPTGIRADLRYSKFASPFATGNYYALTLSRHLGDRMYWDTRFGSQTLSSGVTANNRSNFVSTSLDMNLGAHTYVQSGYTFLRGTTMDDTQWYMSMGYRFGTGSGDTR